MPSLTPPWPPPGCGRPLVYSPPPDLDTEQRMHTHYARAAKALDVQTESGGEFWG